MTIFQLQVLAEVVDSGSFTKAGEKLGLSQSGVSHTISSLESELDITLLYRNRNGITATDSGERILKHVRNILEHNEKLIQETGLVKGLEVGRVKVGAFSSVSSQLLPKILKDFKKVYPGIDVDLYEGGYDEIKSWITSGIVDVGFITLPNSDFDTDFVLKDELYIVLSKEHPLSVHPFLSLDEIEDEPFIMPKAGCEILVKESFKRDHLKPNIAYEISNNHTILAMVEEGLGISIVPKLTIPINLTNVELIKPEPLIFREIGIAVRSFSSAPPAVKSFIETVKKVTY
ncbi:LysR family transcriptional regulator [Chengkuizengella axinellae]|uniref:LysR family transcriptional regulator n=1 Tax=Chengkuizengella axinellae TaxID=3064388 RepID=A0ABT9IX60_9BACL|nr:LysR family transcriptional regulator [Chengkuizengella sp. 2205SS18-9]MDP5273931.1 LysR family transcriptional regulator [Chengkuizengella sp. 2205SS18-9]